MKKRIKTILFSPLSIVTGLTSLSSFRVLLLYFWHDDFSVLYNAHSQVCLFDWPYDAYCPIFGFLYSLFSYNATPYFLIGFTLLIAAALSLYFLAEVIFNKHIAIIMASLFSAGYISAANSLSAYSIITTNLSLFLLFLSLTLLIKFLKSGSIKQLFWSILLFALTINIFPARAFMYIVICLLAIPIFRSEKHISLKKALIVGFLLVINFAFTFFLVPYIKTGNPWFVWSRAGDPVVNQNFAAVQVNNYLLTASSILFPDALESRLHLDISEIKLLRLTIAVFAHLLLVVFLWKNRRNRRKVALIFFALIWILSQYIPQALVTGWKLDSTDRYIIFPYIGFILLTGIFLEIKPRLGKLIIALFIIMITFFSYEYFVPFASASRKREGFFTALRAETAQIPDGSVFYFDAQGVKTRNDLADFMRVGAYKSEVTLALELAVNPDKVSIVVGEEELLKRINNKSIDQRTIFGFFYDGKKLINTTDTLRSVLSGQNKIVKYEKTISLEGDGKRDLPIVIENFYPVLPSALNLKIHFESSLKSKDHQACISVSSKDYQGKVIPLPLKVTSTPQIYEVNLSTMGLSVPHINIGCLPIGTKLTFYSAEVRFASDDKL